MKDYRSATGRLRGTRHKARAYAVEVLFEAETRDLDPVAILDERVQLARMPEPVVGEVRPYTREIVTGVAVNLDLLDEAIGERLADDWVLERLPGVDRSILRVAAWELLFSEEVAAGTSITEAVDLASIYSALVSGKYIHAVLDRIENSKDSILAQVDTAAAVPAAADEVAAAQEEVAVATGSAPAGVADLLLADDSLAEDLGDDELSAYLDPDA